MGKASRRRAERREMTPGERKVLKEMLKESSPQVFGNDKGQVTYYNPLKKLLKQEMYKSEEGFAVTNEMVKKYNQFLKTRMTQEEIAKQKKDSSETVEEYLNKVENKQ